MTLGIQFSDFEKEIKDDKMVLSVEIVIYSCRNKFVNLLNMWSVHTLTITDKHRLNNITNNHTFHMFIEYTVIVNSAGGRK